VADAVERKQLRRRQVALWIVSPTVVILGAVAVLGLRHTFHSSGPFHVGVCFQATKDTGVIAADGLRQISGRAKVVDCGTTHDAEITRTARQASDCAVEGAWLKSRDQIYCVTYSQ
jgi:hypothetical protein